MKTAGSCTKCGAECYEVTKRRAVSRAPLKLGRPLDHARKVTFVLLGGTTMDLTLCETCTTSLSTADFKPLWDACMEAWIAQSPAGAQHPWIKSQINNGIVGLMHARRPE
jgi:hypothetical protein